MRCSQELAIGHNRGTGRVTAVLTLDTQQKIFRFTPRPSYPWVNRALQRSAGSFRQEKNLFCRGSNHDFSVANPVVQSLYRLHCQGFGSHHEPDESTPRHPILHV